MTKSPTRQLTVTYEGVTATRRTAHPYSHVVFGLRSGELEAQRVDATIRSEAREAELRAEALDMIARGVTPPAGHELLKVTCVNGYHRFTRWDNIARRTNDAGQSFTNLTHAEAVEQQAKFDGDSRRDWIVRFEQQAADYRAQGEWWVACSWHHSYALAVKGAEAAKSFCIIRTQIVEVK